jgi:hypothetical protein
LRQLGEAAGLAVDREELIPFELDFVGWRERSSGGPDAAPLIDRLLAEAPSASDAFRVSGDGEERRLHLRYCSTAGSGPSGPAVGGQVMQPARRRPGQGLLPRASLIRPRSSSGGPLER